jgi:hypothetical protein
MKCSSPLIVIGVPPFPPCKRVRVVRSSIFDVNDVSAIADNEPMFDPKTETVHPDKVQVL